MGKQHKKGVGVGGNNYYTRRECPAPKRLDRGRGGGKKFDKTKASGADIRTDRIYVYCVHIEIMVQSLGNPNNDTATNDTRAVRLTEASTVNSQTKQNKQKQHT